jgi:hypothetical protein
MLKNFPPNYSKNVNQNGNCTKNSNAFNFENSIDKKKLKHKESFYYLDILVNAAEKIIQEGYCTSEEAIQVHVSENEIESENNLHLSSNIQNINIVNNISSEKDNSKVNSQIFENDCGENFVDKEGNSLKNSFINSRSECHDNYINQNKNKLLFNPNTNGDLSADKNNTAGATNNFNSALCPILNSSNNYDKKSIRKSTLGKNILNGKQHQLKIRKMWK